MEKPRPSRTIPPDLPRAQSGDAWLDHTLSLLLANETDAALRWVAAVANLGRVAPLLTTLPARERRVLIERFEPRTFEKGEKLMTDEEEASGLYLVAAGEVAIVAHDAGERVVLATVGAGDTLGEVELVLCRRADADAIAVRPTTTLFLARAQFLALATEYPVIAHGLYMTALRKNAETALAMAAPAAVADADLIEDPASTVLPEDLLRAVLEPVEVVPAPPAIPVTPVAVAPAPVAPIASVAPVAPIAPVAPVAPTKSPSTIPPTTVSSPAASRRRRSRALPALLGAGAFVGAALVPVMLALLFGHHRDSAAATALEARNTVVATETARASETLPEAVIPRPAAPPPAASPSATRAVSPRSSVPARVSPSTAAVPSPDPPATSASPEAGTASPPTDEFGGRQ
jgi:CRP-like cAMP-binding protein